MAHKIVMPQLGMAQDAGLIVAWHKAPGDAVGEDDILMEVETDKATMEVPAGKAGVLVEIVVAAGREVPVGEVIAVIGTAEEARVRAAQPAAAAAAMRSPAAAPAAAPQGSVAASPAAAASARRPARPGGDPLNGGAGVGGSAPAAPASRGNGAAGVAAGGAGAGRRNFASPKARRLAAERGIDLDALVAAGVAEPVLVADLDRSPAPRGEPDRAPAPRGEPVAAMSSLAAVAPAEALGRLLALALPTPRAAVLAAFAAGALRRATGRASVRIACRTPRDRGRVFADPDRGGLLALGDAPAADGAPDLTVLDLVGSRVAGYVAGSGGAALVVAAAGENLALTLSFDERTMPLDVAAGVLEDIALRIEDPIRHIL